MTLDELARRLRNLDLDRVAAATLSAEAEQVAEAVRTALSHPAGAKGEAHEMPWLRSGALRDSISSMADATGAIVGSQSTVALHQELGTSRMPPRPFFAPTAASHAEDVATALAEAFVKAIGG